ncbi:hypothetical protein [Ancylobacter radicis]|uniref:Xylose isomerase-like TIM barrel domain-containing protein n=1 Tax=Ancylobacter radicis TaxID=2836179 RepID=A0ABS5R904_9HYPH|nr:hypothetical protein [Ancylobacter radicis]MBS9477314.1 hypothetical protein [Ancylobacter radicis]
MSVIGFSTGAIALDDFETALRLLAPTRANAVELSALRAAELPALLAALPLKFSELQRRYKYISFHAPTNFDDERGLVQQLKVIANMGLNIVVHPDTMHDFAAWRLLGARLCIENMDSRKPTGRTADELAPFFDLLPEAQLCFDVAHARQVDSSMTEAVRILRRYAGRLAQVHISEVNSKGRHFTMSFAAKLAYAPFAAQLSRIPVIIEAMVKRDEIGSEIVATEGILTAGTERALGGGARSGGMALA